jgi:small subunit ribosomal protein S20
MREIPVASEKIAVDQASRRPQARVSTRPSIGIGSEGAACRDARVGERSAVFGYDGCYDRFPASAGLFMANIKQQKKRVRLAARQRMENLRYRSTVRTLMRRLRSAAEEGDAERVSSEHRELQRWIDRAAANGALHRNAAARKKAQAARIAAGS